MVLFPTISVKGLHDLSQTHMGRLAVPAATAFLTPPKPVCALALVTGSMFNLLHRAIDAKKQVEQGSGVHDTKHRDTFTKDSGQCWYWFAITHELPVDACSHQDDREYGHFTLNISYCA